MHDILIQKIIKQWKKEAGASRVIQWTYQHGILTIYTSEPGYLIGKAGILYNKYGDMLRMKLPNFIHFRIVETASLWAQKIHI